MSIEPEKDIDWDAFWAEVASVTEHEVIRTLAYLGEQCVNRVRDRSAEESWCDQTGNLRSSIGYLILKDGVEIVDFGFDSSYGKPQRKSKVEYTTKDGKTVSFMATIKGGGAEGAETGRRYARSLISANSNGFVLLVVAGMEYAEIVESRDNKDVLASTELWARGQIEAYAQKAKERTEKLIERLMSKYLD